MATLRENINQVGADFNAIKEKIVANGVNVEEGTPTRQYAGKIDAVYEAGKQAEHDAFWDAYQGATRRRWASAFLDASWNDTTFYPKHDLIISGDASALFRYCGISDLEGRLNECGVILDTSGATNLNTCFGEAPKLTVIPPINVEKCTASNATNGMFSGCTSLKTIRKIIASEATVFSNTFQNCPMLENITFDGVIGENIDMSGTNSGKAINTKLTRASIESIVNHLSDAAEGKTLTLSKEAADREFPCVWVDESGNEINMGAGGNGDWLALTQSKPNWTITLI